MPLLVNLDQFINEERIILISFVCLSVCAPFCPYNSKTITSIELKFGGQIFHGDRWLPPNLVKFE